MSVHTDYLQTDLDHLLHPLNHPSAHQQAKIWVEGRGAIITDVDGGEYIDGLSGLWCVNVGHGRAELADAARQQMGTLAYCSSYAGSSNLPAIALAERLSALVYPSINTFFFNFFHSCLSECIFRHTNFKSEFLPFPIFVFIILKMLCVSIAI